MTVSNNEEQITPEQASVKIAEYQAIKATAEAERAKQEDKRRQEEASIREANSAEIFKAAVGRTGIRFHADFDELKTALKLTYSVTASNTGDSFRVLDSNGVQVELEKAIESLAISKPFLVHSGADHLKPRDESGAYAQLCRDDFGNNFAAKSRWISENPGLWESLPQHRTAKVTASAMTAAQYTRLPLSEKSKIASEIGEIGIQQILRRKP